MILRRISCVLLALVLATPASAAFELRIAEMWPGNEPGENVTSDWFRITNVGDMPWTAAGDGDLYFDDDSMDWTTADLMSGVASIAPGESAVFIDDMSTTEFEGVWNQPNVVLHPLGTYNGAGLSQGGDGVTLWVSMGAPTANTPIADFEAYPDANLNGGQSWDVGLQAFSTVGNASGAFASAIPNDIGQFAIGAPGTVIPEPSTFVMLISLLCGLVAFRR